MPLYTYLHFPGNCREAFEFYRSVFGGEFEIFVTFGEGPPEMNVPDSEKDGVMHVSYRFGGELLMGSDVPTWFGMTVNQGNNMSLSYMPSSREETDRIFGKLSEGGNVTMPLADQFWGDYFGSVTDRFGVNWMVNYGEQQG